jgi:myosin protein heavy chain
MASPAPSGKGLNDTTGTKMFSNTRDSRAAEAIQMKDQQLKILTEQNSHLLRSLDTVEDAANAVQMEKLATEEENRGLRHDNFELQGKTRASEAQLKKAQMELLDKDKQLKILTDQNAELLRLLETEEAQTAKLDQESRSNKEEADTVKGKYGSLLTVAKTHEDMASKAAREGQLRAEEVRLLRAETEQLRSTNSELKLKTQVELESLYEQLRVRKEKNYQLLEKLQGQEEAKRQAEDQVAGMEDKLRALHAKNVELETQLQVEQRAKRSQQDSNKRLTVDNENLASANSELQSKIERAEQERLRMEAEAKDSGEQLREMAEKVFQLLERLKLAELGKTKAVEALRRKEQEMMAMKKKNARLLKESTAEGKKRVKAELDKKVLVDQIRALKKHNAQLSVRCREEVKAKLKELEERKSAEEKVRTLGGRLSFLLNKMQSDEEAKIVNKEETKKLVARGSTMQEKIDELQQKLASTGESNRIITQAVRLKQEELESLQIQYEALKKKLASKIAEDGLLIEDGDQRGEDDNMTGTQNPEDDDMEQVRKNGGRGRFQVEVKPNQGTMMIKTRRPKCRDFLDRLDMNSFLKKAQKSTNCKFILVEKVAHLLGLLMVEEEDKEDKAVSITDRDDQISHLGRKSMYLQERLAKEEDAKRSTLLRYVHAAKASAGGMDMESGEDVSTALAARGKLQLHESSISDEEMHAIAALLRGSTSITQLNLRKNGVTDEGARALGAVLAGRTRLKNIDLRDNHIGQAGIRALAEALERSERVRHVYVHAGGKIEALGTSVWEGPDGQLDDGGDDAAQAMVTVETICVIDVRDNTPKESGTAAEEALMEAARVTSVVENPAKNSSMSKTSTSRSKQGMRRTKQHASTGQLRGPKAIGSKRGKAMVKVRIADKAAVRQKRQEELKIRQRNQSKEASWSGRSGGLDLSKRKGKTSQSTESLPMRPDSGSALPPLGSQSMETDSSRSIGRSTSAPALNPKLMGKSGMSTSNLKRVDEKGGRQGESPCLHFTSY